MKSAVTAAAALAAAAWAVAPCAAAPAADHHPGETHHRHGSLHFSHPIIAESPSPDTKVRLDYFFMDVENEDGSGTANRFRFEGEYAFHRSFSVELDFPVESVNPDGEASRSNVGNVEIALKFANFVFEEHRLLLGYGIEFGLPTGDEAKGIGSDHLLEFEPFLNVGYKSGKLEAVSFATFGIPTNQGTGEEVETELGYDFSLLYHFVPRLQGLLELDGETVLSGDEQGHTVVNLTPGLKIAPRPASSLQVGLAAGFPVTGAEEFDVRTVLSVFYHF
ncbi:MAG: transporter [Candidatus Krumholzibacteriia bacterium]